MDYATLSDWGNHLGEGSHDLVIHLGAKYCFRFLWGISHWPHI